MRESTETETPAPSALQRLESAAEDAGDAAAKRDWPNADAITRGAERDLELLARQVGNEPVAAARRDLEATRETIASRSGLDAQFAANALSRDVVGLFAGYRTAVPLDVMRLDGLLRQVQLEAEAGSRARARPRTTRGTRGRGCGRPCRSLVPPPGG